MANARGKTVDKTYLSLDTAEERGFIHRDYIAHCLRWSHVIKKLYERKTYQTARILDVGCGRELPMAFTLHSSRLAPRHYFGVDCGPINDAAADRIRRGNFSHTIFENTDILSVGLADLGNEPCNFVTAFEMLEHVEPKHMIQILHHLKTLTTEDCTFFFSTPCWNRVDCADNHVNEMLYESLGSVFERSGFIVKEVYGTFASIRDYVDLLTPAQRELFDALRDYYDSNFLSCIFAPLFPAQSRNVLWELKKQVLSPPASNGSFSPIEEIPQPWSSSANWRDMAWQP